jgi:hypothetical protein
MLPQFFQHPITDDGGFAGMMQDMDLPKGSENFPLSGQRFAYGHRLRESYEKKKVKPPTIFCPISRGSVLPTEPLRELFDQFRPAVPLATPGAETANGLHHWHLDEQADDGGEGGSRVKGRAEPGRGTDLTGQDLRGPTAGGHRHRMRARSPTDFDALNLPDHSPIRRYVP